MRSPYDILGVPPNAGEHDIRKAYRKLAKTYHPDMKPGDAQAEARFREITAAYDLLSDASKRARFDRGEIDAEGRETFAHAYADARAGAGHPFRGGSGGQGSYSFSFSGDGPDDLFDHLFGQHFSGGAGRSRGQDVRKALSVDFTEAALGAVKRLNLGGRTLDVTIPAGLKDGQTLRLKGQGDLGGDLLVEVSVAPHRVFTRKGDDVHVELPVTLAEAVQGAKVPVPTLTGRVMVTVPPGANNGTVLRLKGKGIAGGDQYVTLRLALPERVDAELAGFIARWEAGHPYDPRAGM
jgi:DnaJ-class molecular chaperone with C-terminal Zn finger domain